MNSLSSIFSHPAMSSLFSSRREESRYDPLLSFKTKEPQKPSLDWTGILLDFLLALTSIIFIVFASLTLANDGRALTPDSQAQFLLEATFYVRTRT